MAATRISERLPPLIDPSRAPVAFGRLALPTLIRELHAEERKIRQEALCSLCDLLHDPERAYEALHHGTDLTVITATSHHSVLTSDWSVGLLIFYNSSCCSSYRDSYRGRFTKAINTLLMS